MIAPDRKSIVNAFANAEEPVRVTTLGSCDVTYRGRSLAAPATAKARSLFVYLLMHRGDILRRETLADEFWPDSEPINGRNSLKTALSSIRRALGATGRDPSEFLAVSRDAVSWLAPTSTDASAFERLDAARSDERRAALAIYAGEFLPGDYSRWATATRERLSARYEAALAQELRETRSPRIADLLLSLDPFHDDAYVALIEDARRDGNAKRARAIFHRYARALRELGLRPQPELAELLGVRLRVVPAERASVVGHAAEIADLQRMLSTRDVADGRIVLVTGIAGIGKSATIDATLRQPAMSAAHVVTFDDLGAPAAFASALERIHAAVADGRTVCIGARPALARRLRETFATIPIDEVRLRSLTADEVALAVAPLAADLATTLWNRTGGYPAFVAHLLDELNRIGEPQPGVDLREFVRRASVPPEIDRMLRGAYDAAGDDAKALALVLALEPRLDNDDLAAVLDWPIERVLLTKDHLVESSIFCDDDPSERAPFENAALRDVAATLLPAGPKRMLRERVAKRLRVHEAPEAKLRLAEHAAVLGRAAESAAAYLDAGHAYMSFSAWEAANRAFDAGIAALEPVATSPESLAVVSKLYLSKGRVLNETGENAAALKPLESALETARALGDAATEIDALCASSRALIQVRRMDGARAAAVRAQTLAEERRDDKQRFEAMLLMSRIRREIIEYDASVEIAARGFALATAACDWNAATQFAQNASETLRRMLRFADAYVWNTRQLEIAVLVSPQAEAHAHHMRGTLHFVLERYDDALDEFAMSLELIQSIRRRHSFPPTPVGYIEYMSHYARAATFAEQRRVEEAMEESEWLRRSPWSSTSQFTRAIASSTAVVARLLSQTRNAALEAEEIASAAPSVAPEHPMYFQDLWMRARLHARLRVPDAPALLRAAFDAAERATDAAPDQIARFFRSIADESHDIDRALFEEAERRAVYWRSRVTDAAGGLWRASRDEAAPLLAAASKRWA